MNTARPEQVSRRAVRKAARRGVPATLDSLLGWQATVTTFPVRRSKVTALGGLVLAAALIGALIGASTTPFIGASALGLKAAYTYWNQLPSKLPTLPLPQRSVILDANGHKIAEFYSENRVNVSLAQIPKDMRQAIVAIEDSRFYQDHGIDVRGILRAAVHNATSGSVQGASTLTEQYVKNVLLNAADTTAEKNAVTSRSSYLRKLREARLAVAVEHHLTKGQILQGYLNIAYFGDGAYGVGAAAKHYFGVPVTRLTLPQAALLAGLVQNPTGYDPTIHRATATTRRDTVLFRMHQLGDITTAQYKTAVATPIRLHLTDPANGCIDSRYGMFCQWIKNQLETNPVFGKTATQRQERLYRGGMVIHTTLNPRFQHIAQHAVDTALGRRNRVAANVVTVQPGTGKVVAMAVNRGFGVGPGKTEMVLPALDAYQPGSNMKPFTLAAALERGYNPQTVWDAPPVYIPTGMNYPPGGFTNSGSADAGPLNAAQALWRSSNTWFVHLEQQVGVLNVAAMAERLGIHLPATITSRDAALTLGAYDTSPMDIAAGYATFADHGVYCTPIGITSITGPDGHTIPVPDPNCHEAIPAGVADQVANIMTGTINGPDPYRTGAAMNINRPAGGKTGTTQNNAAVWFSGFTPQYSTSVEVSDPRGGFAHPLYGFYVYGQYIARAYGSTAAGPIWRNVMDGIHQGLPKKAFPPATGSIGFTNTTPDTRGLTLPQAYEVLTKAGFKVTLAPATAHADPLTTANRVAATSPAAGTLVGLGTTVTITLTHGSDLHVQLPDQTTPTDTTRTHPPGQQPTGKHGGWQAAPGVTDNATAPTLGTGILPGH